MKKSAALAVCLLGATCVYWFAQAGDLEPPGDPDSTMVTLQEIYDRVSTSPVGIAKTGQTGCWDQFGDPVDCAGTGQDGEYRAGVSVDPRFTDNGNGTVTDNLTGLIWLQDANCLGVRTWTSALSDANNLADGSCGLTDSSVAGDWRLPNLKELQSLFDYGQRSPAFPSGHPFSGMQLSGYYWSSTTVNDIFHAAWDVSLNSGFVGNEYKTAAGYVWAVRGGQ
jgi:hypothetical protein